jgi:hypothetical protein
MKLAFAAFSRGLSLLGDAHGSSNTYSAIEIDGAIVEIIGFSTKLLAWNGLGSEQGGKRFD